MINYYHDNCSIKTALRSSIDINGTDQTQKHDARARDCRESHQQSANSAFHFNRKELEPTQIKPAISTIWIISHVKMSVNPAFYGQNSRIIAIN